MISGEKPDAEEIRAFLRELKAEPWLDEQQRHWPEHLFHVTDIQNAASILSRGEILSRKEATRLRIMTNDNAAPEIIAATAPEYLDAVRLYFRPRTPTAYNNEGIRPQRFWVRDAHCPIPVMFVLKAEPILVREGVRFSDGSLARHGQARVGDSAAFLRTIPFQQVYHYSAFLPSDRDEIVFRRQAEVIVPNHLSIDQCLLGVYVRSAAELEMLEGSMVGHASTIQYRLAVNGRNSLFFKLWTYLERVAVVDSDLRLEFNPSSMTPGPFTLAVTVTDIGGSTTYSVITAPDFMAKGVSTFRLPISLPSQIRIQIRLDGMLTYDAVKRRSSELMRRTA
jgi:hypothetical protein